MTSEAFEGVSMGGLAGADARRQAAAGAAGLTGVYMAWLSGGGETPLTRFLNIDRTGPYMLVSPPNFPLPVAKDIEQINDCDSGECLYRAIDRTEHGEKEDGARYIWTGALATGAEADNTCEGWQPVSENAQGAFGISSATGTTWTELATQPCVVFCRLYCFEQAV